MVDQTDLPAPARTAAASAPAPADRAAPAADEAARTGRDAAAHRSPESPEEDHWLSLGLKVSGAMLLGDLVARLCGFEDPTWSVITAALLATSPPFASARPASD